MPTAYLLTDRDHAPRLSRTRTGLAGERTYRVDTADEVAALQAAGLPAYGDDWSASVPGLRVVELSTEYVAGTDDPVTGTGAYTRVTVRYETPGASVLPPATPGFAWTEYAQANEVITVYEDLRNVLAPPGSPRPFPLPIANNQGAPKAVGAVQAHVHQYQFGDTIQWPRIIKLVFEQAVNSDWLLLPPILGTTFAPLLAPLEARYVAFAPQPVYSGIPGNGLVHVTHVIQIAPVQQDEHGAPPHSAFDWSWREQDDRGYLTGPGHISQLYLRLPMAGLWP